MTYIRIEGADAILKRITSLAQLRALRAPMKAAAIHIKGKIATYPGGNQHRKVDASQWSAKQRRGFFAKLRSGEIEVPYRRGASPGSERMGAKWTIAARDSGLTQVIGNNASYGPLVQGANQTGYHAQTGWNTVDKVAEEETPTVLSYLSAAIERILGK